MNPVLMTALLLAAGGFFTFTMLRRLVPMWALRRENRLDQPAVRTMDTAATVLWLLGLTEQSDWIGEAVIRAYEPSPVRVAASIEYEKTEKAPK